MNDKYSIDKKEILVMLTVKVRAHCRLKTLRKEEKGMPV